MRDFAEGVALLAEQDRIIKAAKAEQVRIKTEMVERFSPVKIGEIVEANAGYAYQGKQIRVEAVTVCDKRSWRSEVGFVASGAVLRKDGTPGANTAEHYAAP